MPTLDDLRRELQRIELEINNFSPNPPQLVNTNDDPPKKVIPESEKDRVKREKAQDTAQRLSPVLFDFITERALEIAKEEVEREIGPIRERLEETRRRLSELDARLESLGG